MRFAIVGAAEERPGQSPSVDVTKAREAAKSLGTALAKRGHGRMVFERRYGSGPLVPPSMAVTIALGLMAGAMAGMLYIVAQPGDIKVTPDTAGLRLVSLVLVVATVGGLTAEAVFRKLLGIDVLRTGGLSANADGAGK